MSYAAIANIRSRMAQFEIESGTKPTEAQAVLFLDEASAEIDLILASKGLTVPVATPAYFLTWLRNVEANGATAAVLKSMFPDATGPGEVPAYAFYEKRYRDALALLRDGDIIPDALLGEVATDAPSTYFTRNPEEEETFSGISEPTFRYGHDF